MKNLFVNVLKKRRNYSALKENVYEKYPKSKPFADKLKYAYSLHEEAKYEEARKAFDESVANLSKHLPEDHPLMAIAYNNLAEALRKTMDLKGDFIYKDVEHLYNLSLSIMLKPEYYDYFEENIGTLYNNYGVYYLEKKEYQKAIEKLEKSREVREKILKDRSGSSHLVPTAKGNLGVTLHNIGLCKYTENNFDEALSYFLKSKVLIEESHGKTHMFYGKLLHNIGEIYLNLKDYPISRKYHIESLEIIPSNEAYYGVDLCITYNTIASCYFFEEKHEECIEFLTKQIQLLESRGNPNPNQLGVIYGHLSFNYSKLGNTEKAKEFAKKSISLQKVNHELLTQISSKIKNLLN